MESQRDVWFQTVARTRRLPSLFLAMSTFQDTELDLHVYSPFHPLLAKTILLSNSRASHLQEKVEQTFKDVDTIYLVRPPRLSTSPHSST